MFYKIRNILSVSALALLLGTSISFDARALITLSEEAANDDVSKDIPDEFAMFNENDDSAPAPSGNKQAVTDEIFAPGKIIPKTGVPAAPASAGVSAAAAPAAPAAPSSAALQNEIISSLNNIDDEPAMDDNLFSQMSDIEKQTALLNLELRREKIKNEIEAIKNQRRQALIQEQEKKEAQEKQKIEWEKAQEQKVLQEQQKLRELDIEFEKLRQERVLNAYKNKYLEDAQKWIAHDAGLYKQIEDTKKENQKVLDDSKDKFTQLKNDINAANTKAANLISRHKQKVDDLNAQIGVLKARIIAQEKELEASRQNPFEDIAAAAEESDKKAQAAEVQPAVMPELKLPNMYAVMEIRGQGGELIAKLVNQDGTPFYVKKGTTLQSGHTIDEITSTYVRADKGGVKDYLYFAAGGILPLEQPANSLNNALAAQSEAQQQEERPDFVSSVGIPGVGSAMMVR